MSFRYLPTLLATLAIALVYSCSQSPAITNLAPEIQLPAELASLPFPDDRATAALVNTTIKGNETFDKSDGPVSSLNALAFDVPAGVMHWAIYQFSLPVNDSLQRLDLDIALESGNAPWLGLADYSLGRWHFDGQLATGSEKIDLTSGPDFTSPLGNFYFAVIGYDTSKFTINGATVVTDTPDLTYSISGTIYDPLDFVNVEDVDLFLSPLGIQVLSDATGAYSFTDIPPGSYTITPSKAGNGFLPDSTEVEVVDADITGVDFAIEDLGLPQYDVSGNVQFNASGLENVLLSLNPGGYSAMTDANGDFSIGGIVNGSYTLTPSLAGYEFTPPSINLDVSDADSTGNDFIASEVPPGSYGIYGAVSVGSGFLQNVTLTLTPGGSTTQTDGSGNYEFTNLDPGSYTVTPSKQGFLFTPPSANVEITNADVGGVDFDAYPDNSGNFNVSGVIQGPPGGLSGATVVLNPGNYFAQSGSGGGYTILNVPSGIYTATCSKSGWLITPDSQEVIVVDQNVTGVNWFATPPL